MSNIDRFNRNTVARGCVLGLLCAMLLQVHPLNAAGAGLDSLLATALRQNPRIRAAEAAYRSLLEKVPQAGALPDPMLNLIAEEVPLSTAHPGRAAIKRMGLTQMLPFPGKQGLMKGTMYAEAMMAQAEHERARLEVAAELAGAYYDLYMHHESIAVIEENRTALAALAEAIQTRYEVGGALQQDLVKARVELAREANQLIVHEAEIPTARARINALLDRPSDHPIDHPALGDTVFALSAVETLEETARTRQPMLLMKDRAVERSERALDLARKAGLPDFTIGLEYMTEEGLEDTWTVMLGITLPVWRWNKVVPMRREAEHALARARSERRQTENEVGAIIREVWARVSVSRALAGLYRDTVLPQAELAVESARTAYEANRADFLDLLDSFRQLLGARIGFVEAVAEDMKSRAALALAAGDLELLGVDHD
jgi:outer membrane protein TolC